MISVVFELFRRALARIDEPLSALDELEFVLRADQVLYVLDGRDLLQLLDLKAFGLTILLGISLNGALLRCFAVIAYV